MATLFQFPLRNDLYNYQMKISLSSTYYIFNFRFNSRMNRWFYDISDPVGNTIIYGMPVLILRDDLYQYRHLNVPVGVIIAVDESQDGSQPTQYSFGVTHTLYYEDPTQ